MIKSTPLTNAVPHTRVRVVAIRGGRRFHERINSMGLYIGCELNMMVNGQEGRMVVAIGDTRLALGHGMAEKIWVRPETA